MEGLLVAEKLGVLELTFVFLASLIFGVAVPHVLRADAGPLVDCELAVCAPLDEGGVPLVEGNREKMRVD